jgi:hypothetical protein
MWHEVVRPAHRPARPSPHGDEISLSHDAGRGKEVVIKKKLL